MGFWKKLFGRRQKNSVPMEEQEIDYDNWENLTIRNEDIDMEDAGQREKYVRCLLDQIRDAEHTLQSLTGEYGIVTSYLKDMEEIEALPAEEKADMLSCAMKLRALEQSREKNPMRNSRMGDEQYHRMERMEPEIEEGIRKISDAENYRELIRKDLKRLDAERQAYEIRQKDLEETMNNTKSVSVICICAMAVCMAALLILQFAFRLDSRIGYILTGFVTAGVLTFVFVRYREASLELNRVDQCINRLILLQNRVKIRYVNNTNLLDYLYFKYMTESGEALEKSLQLFYEEREERERYARMLEDLTYYQKELMKILKRYQLYDPAVWLHQTEALLEPKEMVEIRHEYIGRRQRLRKQMEKNQQLADYAKDQIRRIAEKYPAYAGRLLEIVNEYD